MRLRGLGHCTLHATVILCCRANVLGDCNRPTIRSPIIPEGKFLLGTLDEDFGFPLSNREGGKSNQISTSDVCILVQTYLPVLGVARECEERLVSLLDVSRTLCFELHRHALHPVTVFKRMFGQIQAKLALQKVSKVLREKVFHSL